MVNHIIHDGKSYPVNDAWHEANTVPWPHFALMNHTELDNHRWEILRYSNDFRLSEEQQDELTSVTNHFNVRNALKVLGCPDLAKFGFTGADQLHGNRFTADCGCQFHYVFDHHVSFAKTCARDIAEPSTNLEVQYRRTMLWKYASAMVGLQPNQHEDALGYELTLQIHEVEYVCRAHTHLKDDPEALQTQLRVESLEKAEKEAKAQDATVG